MIRISSEVLFEYHSCQKEAFFVKKIFSTDFLLIKYFKYVKILIESTIKLLFPL